MKRNITRERSKKHKLKYPLKLLGLLAIGYLVLHLFPQIVFSNKINQDAFTIYTVNKMPAGIDAVIGETQCLLRNSSLYKKEYDYSVFFCNDRLRYRLFAPLSGSSFAITMSISQNIFVAGPCVAENLSHRFGDLHHERRLSSVIAHETCHVLLEKQVGSISNFFLPTWIKEGYCEYIAQDSSFDEERGDLMIIQGEKEKNFSFKYLEYRRMVEYLITQEGMSIEALIEEPPLQKDVLEKTRQWLRARMIDSGKGEAD